MGDRAIERFIDYAGKCEEGAPEGDYHYLGILGVLPPHRRNGYGRRLVEAVKAEAARHASSKGLVLNTESLPNVSYYESLGFRVIDERPCGWVTTWAMLWDENADSSTCRKLL